MLNDGLTYKFTEAISFAVGCDSQQEVDDYWSKLSAGGTESCRGWQKDKFDLSRQIVPRLPELINHPKAMQAMLKMKKFAPRESNGPAPFRLQLRLVKVREVIRWVESDGWRHVRTTSSHRHYKHPSKPNVVTIPGHFADELPKGTLKSILKAAGLEPK